MKRRSLMAGLTAIALATFSAAFKPAQAATKMAGANNEFALALYSPLSKQAGNLCFSPPSIGTGLSMTYAGARGETARQMAQVLRFSTAGRDVHAAFGSMLQELAGANAGRCRLVLANGLWAQSGYPFLAPFQKLLHDTYAASLNQIDLTGWPGDFDPLKAAAARKQINDWGASQTGGRIPELMPLDLPSHNTRLVLLNAIWFKGQWDLPFDRGLTKLAAFHPTSREAIAAPTMHLQGEFAYAEADGVQVLKLPYVSNRVAMVIFLPRATDGLANFERKFTMSQINRLCGSAKPRQVRAALPKFRCASEIRLEDPLRQMGITAAFSMDQADFSGMTKRKPFFIEAAIHKTYVAVDEEGTEAASATIILMADGIPIIFNADHPFLFLIRDNATGAILFLGRVVDPLAA